METENRKQAKTRKQIMLKTSGFKTGLKNLKIVVRRFIK